MKLLLFFTLLSISSLQAACLPEGILETSKSLTNAREIELAVDDFDQSIRRVLPGDVELTIQMDVLNPRTNAEITKVDTGLRIQLMGGMIQHPKMDPYVMKLLLCHEIGHYLGGPPLKSRTGWSSTEGQADYYSTLTCARQFDFDEDQLIKSSVELTSIYAEVMRESPPSVDQCEQRTAERTNYGYPSVQCRLDTLLAGWNKNERPNCWYRK